MSMPKGFKTTHGYATVRATESGLGYREIAEHMTEKGDTMNHSTARNIFLSAMSKFASNACSLYAVQPNREDINRISADPRFQSAILDMIKEMDV